MAFGSGLQFAGYYGNIQIFFEFSKQLCQQETVQQSTSFSLHKKFWKKELLSNEKKNVKTDYCDMML